MSGKGNEGDSIWTVVWGVFVVALFSAFIWYMGRAPILQTLRWVRWTELAVISPIDPAAKPCMTWLRTVDLIVPDTLQTPSDDAIRATNACFGPEFLRTLPPQGRGSLSDYFGLSAPSMAAIEAKAAPYYRWPLFAVFAGIAVYIVFFSKYTKFKVRHNLESFIRIQAKMWPVILPIVNFNPTKASARAPGDMVPDKLPPFAEALSPEEWLSWHRIPVTNGIPDREATRRAFLLQLGPRWNGYEGLPIHIRALFAAFALKGSLKRDESDAFLGRLAPCWSLKGGFAVPGDLEREIDKILADPAAGGKALEIADRHAYRTTALLGVLRWARWQGGVLAAAQFLWLRAADRVLWYPLNNLGRRSFHVEGAGAMAHFMAEENAKKPLPIPRVDTAIVTLNSFLSDASRSHIPIPPREGDTAKARG
jgi:intracellular multiplication protein IcmP